MCQVKRSGLVPDVTRGCRATTAEETEELLGLPLGYTRYFGANEVNLADRRTFLGQTYQVPFVGL